MKPVISHIFDMIVSSIASVMGMSNLVYPAEMTGAIFDTIGSTIDDTIADTIAEPSDLPLIDYQFRDLTNNRTTSQIGLLGSGVRDATANVDVMLLEDYDMHRSKIVIDHDFPQGAQASYCMFQAAPLEANIPLSDLALHISFMIDSMSNRDAFIIYLTRNSAFDSVFLSFSNNQLYCSHNASNLFTQVLPIPRDVVNHLTVMFRANIAYIYLNTSLVAVKTYDNKTFSYGKDTNVMGVVGMWALYGLQIYNGIDLSTAASRQAWVDACKNYNLTEDIGW